MVQELNCSYIPYPNLWHSKQKRPAIGYIPIGARPTRNMLLSITWHRKIPQFIIYKANTVDIFTYKVNSVIQPMS